MIPWLDIAIAEQGVSEVAGAIANPRIIEYDSVTSLKATSDEIAWCSAFACWCMEQAGVPSPKSARARDWLTWGESIGKPILGAVVILSRGSNPQQGHVGFFVSESTSRIQILGGNQGNKVSIISFPKEMVIGYRVPLEDYWSPYAKDTESDPSYS